MIETGQYKHYTEREASVKEKGRFVSTWSVLSLPPTVVSGRMRLGDREREGVGGRQADS